MGLEGGAEVAGATIIAPSINLRGAIMGDWIASSEAQINAAFDAMPDVFSAPFEGVAEAAKELLVGALRGLLPKK